jgi:hypothetical protein
MKKKSQTAKLFLFLALFILSFKLVFSSSSMGVSPPTARFIFIDQDVIESTFTVLPYEEKNIKLFVTGDLADYIFFENNQNVSEFRAEGPTEVKYYIKPPKDLKPGSYRTPIVVTQFFTPEERIRSGGFLATAAIGFIVNVRVPNEGKFLETNIKSEPAVIKLGDVVYFTIDLLNVGTEDLRDLETDVVVKNPEGKEVSRKSSTKIDLLKPAEGGSIMSYWETKGSGAGLYKAEADIEYGGKSPAKATSDLRLGDILIKILDIRSEFSESIGKIFIDVESNWNDAISNVYAEVVIKNSTGVVDKIKTSSVNLEPWGKATLTAFWERKTAAPGDYSMEVYVYYYDKQANQQVIVKLPELEKPSPFGKMPLMIVAVLLLAAILVINIAWFIIKARKKEDKKEQ